MADLGTYSSAETWRIAVLIRKSVGESSHCNSQQDLIACGIVNGAAMRASKFVNPRVHVRCMKQHLKLLKILGLINVDLAGCDRPTLLQ